MAWRGRAAAAAIALSLLTPPAMAADAEPSKPAVTERTPVAREVMVRLMTIFAYHYAPQGYLPAAPVQVAQTARPPAAPTNTAAQR